MEQWAENDVERELAEMTGSLEQLGGLEEKEEGEEESGSWLRELFARVLVARVVFVEGSRAFKGKTQEVHSGEKVSAS